MAAIITGKNAGAITISTKDAEIRQDDENGERIIAEARWHLPGFKNRTNFSAFYMAYLVILVLLTFLVALPVIIIYIVIIYGIKKPIKPGFNERLYLTESSIVYTSVRDRHQVNLYHHNFRINLANISHIKSIGHETFQASAGWIEVRAHDVVVFQLKEDSTEEIHFGHNPGPLDCCFDTIKSVDSFAFLCHNGEEFVKTVKEQMAALNIK